MAKKLKLSIQERLDLLSEAVAFFQDIWPSDDITHLWLVKACALSTVKDCLDLFQERVLKWAEWTEKTLQTWLATVVDRDYIKKMEEKKWMSQEEINFYEGWFGLAVGIVEWDKEAIDSLRELQDAYDKVLEAKASNKTIADLIK